MGNSVTVGALDDLVSPPCALVAISPGLVASDARAASSTVVEKQDDVRAFVLDAIGSCSRRGG
jgi:tellurite resistance protein